MTYDFCLFLISNTILFVGDFEWHLSSNKLSHIDRVSGVKLEGENDQRSLSSEYLGPDCLNQPDLCEEGLTVEFTADVKTKGVHTLFRHTHLMFIHNCLLFTIDDVFTGLNLQPLLDDDDDVVYFLALQTIYRI